MRVLDAIGHRLGTEATKDHGVNRTHAAAGKHGDGSLGNHGHVDQHHVPFLDTSGLEHVGKEADLAMKLPVGQGTFFGRFSRGCRFAFPDQGGLIGLVRIQIAIQTVHAHVGLPSNKPLGMGCFPLQDLAPGLEPDQFLLGLFAPEGFRLAHGAIVHLLVGSHRSDVSLLGKIL